MNCICLSRVLKTFSYFSSLRRPQTLRSIVFRQNGKSYSSGQFPLDNISNLKKDVLLYTYEKPKLFKFLTFVGPIQLAVWIFYGGFMFANLKDVSESDIKVEEALADRSTLWRRINLGEMKYRIISAALCLAVGISTAVICFALPSRIIRQLTLFKGGKDASIVTYGLFGKPLKQTVPLQNLSCHISRQQAKSYIAVKIKKKWFYYLVDIKGQFHQPVLFDYTVGTKKIKAY